MGCFIGCFSSSKDRKRRKHRYKAIRRDQNPKSQNLVQADVSLEQSINNKPSDSLPESRGKSEEPLTLTTRKKVTFDTNVTTYEHVQLYDSTESLLEKNDKGETFPKSEGPDSPNGGSYPPNYRYGNCLESDDELEVSDYEDENDNGTDDEKDYNDEDDDEDGIISSSESRIEPALSPVFKPVENLSQWKVLKSKGTVTLTEPPKPLTFDPQKENLSLNFKNQNHETAVEASLNWMVTPEKNPPNSKRVGSYNPDLEPISYGKSFSQESTVTSVKSIEDRPILGALTADELKQFSGSGLTCTPRKSPGKSPDDMVIIGSVGSYWSHSGSAQSLSPSSGYKGIPNATNKYREDKKVNWQNIPFETRLERALNEDVADY